MKSSIENHVVSVLGMWQVLDGVITIILYGLFKRHQMTQITGLTYENAKAINSMFGSTFILISIFGAILIALGLLNLVMSKRYLKEQKNRKKCLLWFVFVAGFSLLVMDIISLILSIVSIVLVLAKGQAEKKYRGFV